MSFKDEYSATGEIVILRVGLKYVKIRKDLLMYHSLYFKDLLSGFGTTCVYNIEGDEDVEEIICQIVQWMQTGTFTPEEMKPSLFVQLFNTVIDLKMPELEKLCKEYLTNALQSTDGSAMYKAIKCYGNKAVCNHADFIFTRHFDDIIKGSYFLKMDVEDLCHILNDNNVVTNSELSIFHACMMWLHHEWSFRKKYAPLLLSCVRFALLPKTFLVHLPIQISSCLAEFPEIKDLILKGFMYHEAIKIGWIDHFPYLMPVCRVKLPIDTGTESQSYTSLISHLPSYRMTGGEHIQSSTARESSVSSKRDLKKFRAIQNSLIQQRRSAQWPRVQISYPWMSEQEQAAVIIQSAFRGYLDRLKVKRYINAAIVIQKWYRTCQNIRCSQPLAMLNKASILVIGGISSGENWIKPASKMLRFNPSLKWWRDVGNTPQPFVYSACAKIKDCIFITGGFVAHHNYIDKEVLKTTWCLNYVIGKWVRCADMHYARAYHALVSFRGNLYCVGGKGKNGEVLSSLECMVPEENCWYELESMPTPRMSVAAAIYNQNLWVCGGIVIGGPKICSNASVTEIVEIYFPNENRWQLSAPLCIPRKSAMIVKSQKTLFLIGGIAHRSHPPAEYFKTDTNSWCIQPTLYCSRESAVSVTLDDKIYVIGGYSVCEHSELDRVDSYIPKFAFRIPAPRLPYPLTAMVAAVMDPV